MTRYAAFSPYPSSGLVKGKISAIGMQISPAMRKIETSGLTTHEAITPAVAIFPIAEITIGAVKSCAPTDAEILPAKAGGIFPLSRWAQASPKMMIPAQAPYESMNPSVIASAPAIAICTVNMAHSTDKGGGFNPRAFPAAAIQTIPNARFNEGAEPANQTKRKTAASENHTALLLCPNILPPCSAAVPISERCIPDKARI